MPIARGLSHQLRIPSGRRLILDHFIDLVIEARIIGVDGVVLLVGQIDELRRFRILGIGKRVDLEGLLECLDGLLGLSWLGGDPHQHPVTVGRCLGDEISFRNLPFVVRRPPAGICPLFLDLHRPTQGP